MKKMQLHKLSLLKNIEAILLAIILNLNGVKILLETKSNVLTYGVFVIFAVVSLFNKIISKNNKFKFNKSVISVVFIFIFCCLISIFLQRGQDIDVLFKFAVGVVIAYLAGNLSVEQRILTIKYSVGISALYAIYIYLNYNEIYSTYIKTGVYNYLVVTLPVGLGLSFALASLLLCKKTKGEMFFYTFVAFIQLFALIQYPARGNILFPFAVALVLMLYSSKGNYKRFFLNIIKILLVGILVLLIIWNYASEYILQRFSRLFMSAGDEPRMILYDYLINYYTKNVSYLFGTGFSSSNQILSNGGFAEHYPHNFILELVGEMGLIGMALIIVVLVQLLKKEKDGLKQLKLQSNNQYSDTALEFWFVNSGLLFYLFTYFKSYSIYDGYQLFIFIAMLLHMNQREYNKQDV